MSRPALVSEGDTRLELAAQVKESHAALRRMVVVRLGARAALRRMVPQDASWGKAGGAPYVGPRVSGEGRDRSSGPQTFQAP